MALHKRLGARAFCPWMGAKNTKNACRMPALPGKTALIIHPDESEKQERKIPQ
jgi:hypothetical protein